MLFNRKTGEARPTRWPAAFLAPWTRRAACTGADGARTRSVIDASLAIVGDLRSEGDVQVDGHICGNVAMRAADRRPETRRSPGAVTAEQAVMRGRITGTIRRTLVILQDTGQCRKRHRLQPARHRRRAPAFEGAARRSANPLEEDDGPVSALADLQADDRLRPGPGKAPCAADGNGHRGESEAELPAQADNAGFGRRRPREGGTRL